MSDVAELFERVLRDLEHDTGFAGVEFVARSVRRTKGSQSLRVTIDREGGVDMKTCEAIATAISNRINAFAIPFTLEVESAGLERPLTKPGDYNRFSGRDAKVTTTLSIDGGKTHRGVLRGVRGSNVILETPAGELPLPLATIKSANLEYDIRADLQRDKKERKNHHG